VLVVSPYTSEAYRVTCAYRLDAKSDEGDSGAPVFFRYDDDNVVLSGVHFGSDSNDRAYFSSIGAVEGDLGSMVTSDPIPPLVTLTGPDEVRPEVVDCLWHASASHGFGTLSYQWYEDDEEVGINSTNYSDDDTGTENYVLKVTVTDAVMNSVSDTKSITIDAGAPGC
jgi:hypothetical protein